jgi:uncharacterized membrane protein YgdD (TMEM256/DUF423 family)
MVLALLGALSGFLYVAIGAFGAHGISDPHARELIETGGRYHGIHTLALFLIVSLERWGAPRAFAAAPFFAAGLLLFCGGLYAIAFGAPQALAILIPIGGVSFMIGWLLIGWAALQLAAKRADA